MRNWWIRFGCFMTGFNYNIVSASSEVSAKAVKRYTSAMLIVCIIWAFVGYSFTDRYLRGNTLASIAGAIILVVIIIQVERQIILSVHRNWGLYTFRAIIAIMMALIGSIIIDQIIFKEDIEQEKILLLDEKVKKVLPAKSEELRRQIRELDTAVYKKEFERQVVMNDISANPTIPTITVTNQPVTVTSTTTDSGKITSTSKIINARTSSRSEIPNPKIELLTGIDQQLNSMRVQKAQKDSMLLQLRPAVEAEIKSKVGFLDELELMYSLLSKSNVALTVWLVWLGFLLGLELFILFSKVGEKRNDYDETVLHQMELQVKKLRLLSRPTVSEN